MLVKVQAAVKGKTRGFDPFCSDLNVHSHLHILQNAYIMSWSSQPSAASGRVDLDFLFLRSHLQTSFRDAGHHKLTLMLLLALKMSVNEGK